MLFGTQQDPVRATQGLLGSYSLQPPLVEGCPETAGFRCSCGSGFEAWTFGVQGGFRAISV